MTRTGAYLFIVTGKVSFLFLSLFKVLYFCLTNLNEVRHWYRVGSGRWNSAQVSNHQPITDSGTFFSLGSCFRVYNRNTNNTENKTTLRYKVKHRQLGKRQTNQELNLPITYKYTCTHSPILYKIWWCTMLQSSHQAAVIFCDICCEKEFNNMQRL